MPAARQIEVIKGPASSLYGAEAIGGAVNIITQAPPALFTGKVSAQTPTPAIKERMFRWAIRLENLVY